MGKPLVKSVTFWFNFVMFLLGVLALPELKTVVPSNWFPYLALLSAAGNVFIRMVQTQQPISGFFK